MRSSNKIGAVLSALLFATLACGAIAEPADKVAAKPTANAANEESIRQAQEDGELLYEAFEHDVKPSPAFAALARGAIRDLCDFNYRELWVDRGATGSVYLIAESGDSLIWGRHYRVDINKESKTVDSVTPSTKSCIGMKRDANALPGAQIAGAGTTHLLSDTPTEFHVFLSETTKLHIFVATRAGKWNVAAGKISSF